MFREVVADYKVFYFFLAVAAAAGNFSGVLVYLASDQFYAEAVGKGFQEKFRCGGNYEVCFFFLGKIPSGNFMFVFVPEEFYFFIDVGDFADKAG